MAGNLYVVAAPSGAGKTTLVRLLLDAEREVRLSISCTTRPPRPGEVDGREYRFLDRKTFDSMVDRGEFLEWAEVHGNCYGTSKTWIEEELAAGHDVLLEIDWQGAQQVRELFPTAVGVFILPPSLEELERRLRGRGTDSAEVIGRRLAAAQAEMRHVGEFDYVIINNELQRAAEELRLVVRASRLRFVIQRQRHADLIDRLL
ncbi:MAG TPA: guanylate kinase [Rhodocyclaceae bacterium]|jgi:guanylate kinase|nr:guanylate kinase [Rhodocyclaceae bacterium]HMW77165.1 guanylate kinase [Rhodocyclaceae bacterium]HNE43753.1 guanylate kinase [Rhodocyclaceae bacterium]HNL20380.1 guanylate kinase [Rhodocyclaceae bacterium]HNM22055.1 guanylate kinase [Rhodocyclaceae bacterium]